MWLRPLLREFKNKAVSAGRLAALLLVASAVVAGTVYGLAVYVVPGIAGHPYFGLKSVKVTSDDQLDKPAELVARAELYEGTSLWRIDTDRVERAVEKTPWVRDARVEKRFPNEVSLRVYKREPVAATIHRGGVYLIDAAGIVYREPLDGVHPDVPYLTGWSDVESSGDRVALLRRAMEVVHEAGIVGIDVSQVDVDADGHMWLYLERAAIPVRLGDDSDPESSLGRLALVLASVAAGSEQIEEIDLSYADRAVVRARQGHLPALIAQVHRSGSQEKMAAGSSATSLAGSLAGSSTVSSTGSSNGGERG